MSINEQYSVGTCKPVETSQRQQPKHSGFQGQSSNKVGPVLSYNQLEPLITDSNQPEQMGTSWNQLEPIKTSQSLFGWVSTVCN